MELKFGVGELYEHMEGLIKFQLKWIHLATTPFTKLLSGQKLWKFAEEDLVGKWS